MNITKSESDYLFNDTKYLKTSTGEIFQPMRLYYIVHNRDRLEDSFQELKCLKQAKPNEWVLQYTNEANNIRLDLTSSEIREEDQPITIAKFYIQNQNEMIIDVHSIERATKLIQFLNDYIPKDNAEITHAAIYNELYTVPITKQRNFINNIDFNKIFNPENTVLVSSKRIALEMQEITRKSNDFTDENSFIMKQIIDEILKMPLPSAEKFPIYFYELGVIPLATTCMLRQVIAKFHCDGDENYSFYDLVQDLRWGRVNIIDCSKYIH